nr:flavanone 3-hydroxylase [Tanacetum cinerariifolium]
MVSTLQSWPEPVVRVQSVSDSGTNAIPECYVKAIYDRPSSLDNISSIEANDIPIIDLANLYANDPNLRKTTMDIISHACREWGMFQEVKEEIIAPIQFGTFLHPNTAAITLVGIAFVPLSETDCTRTTGSASFARCLPFFQGFLGKVVRKYMIVSEQNWEIRMSQVPILGPVGYGPTMLPLRHSDLHWAVRYAATITTSSPEVVWREAEMPPAKQLEAEIVDSLLATHKHPIPNMIFEEHEEEVPRKLYSKEIPSSFEPALKSEKWKKAMDDEMKALKKNKTWDQCALPQEKKPVGSRWIFTVKYKPDGKVERYKARNLCMDSNSLPKLGLEEIGMINCKPADTPMMVNHKLFMEKKANWLIETDADWAGDKGNRRSTSGYFSLVGGNLVTWRSKKQKVVSLSSAEAEFRGIAKGLAEALYIRKLVSEIGFPPRGSTQIMCDNKAAIQISEILYNMTGRSM